MLCEKLYYYFFFVDVCWRKWGGIWFVFMGLFDGWVLLDILFFFWDCVICVFL